MLLTCLPSAFIILWQGGNVAKPNLNERDESESVQLASFGQRYLLDKNLVSKFFLRTRKTIYV